MTRQHRQAEPDVPGHAAIDLAHAVGCRPQVLRRLHDVLLQLVQRLRRDRYRFLYVPGHSRNRRLRGAGCRRIRLPAADRVFRAIYSHYVETKKYFSNEINVTSHSDSPLQWIFGLFQYNERNYQTPGNCIRPGPNAARDAAQSHRYALRRRPIRATQSTCSNRKCMTIPMRHSPRPTGTSADLEAHHRDCATPTIFSRAASNSASCASACRLVLATLSAHIPAPVHIGRVYAGQLTSRSPTRRLPIAVHRLRRPAQVSRRQRSSLSAAQRQLGARLGRQLECADRDARGRMGRPIPTRLAYLKYSRGYKSGGFNASTISANPESQPEHLDAFELGGKEVFNRNLANQRCLVLLQLQGQADSVDAAGDDSMAARTSPPSSTFRR